MIQVTITVTRDSSYTGEALLGKISCGSITGHSLERKDKHIKTGTYKVIIGQGNRQSLKYDLFKFNDKDTVPYTKIYIHRGNYVRNSAGCMLVGTGRGKEKNGDGCVWSSKVMLNKLIDYCQSYQTIYVKIQ